MKDIEHSMLPLVIVQSIAISSLCPAHAGSRCDPHRPAQIRDQESTDDHVEADGRWKDRGRRNAVGYLSDIDVPTVEGLSITK